MIQVTCEKVLSKLKIIKVIFRSNIPQNILLPFILIEGKNNSNSVNKETIIYISNSSTKKISSVICINVVTTVDIA